jgi:hypothetical protein
MTGLYGFAVKIVVYAMLGSVLPQTPAAPLSKELVTKLFSYEKAKGNDVLKDSTKNEVERVGVDFELDAKTEQEFSALGMDRVLLNVIRSNPRITSLAVQCEPVECEVSIYDEVVGTTVASNLIKYHVKPGLVPIKVAAAGFEIGRLDVPVSAGENVKVRKFTLEPLKGGLAVTCVPTVPVIADPLVCGITIIGPRGFSTKGVTTEGRFTLGELPTGEYDIEASAPPCYVAATVKTWVTAPAVRTEALKLEPDDWGCKTDMQVFDAIVDSLGGKGVLTAGSISKSSARMRVVGDPPSIGMWNGIQVTEYVAPNRLRWDMTIAATKWNVIYDGTRTGSSGDKKKYSGTEFAQELEHSIRLFSAMRLPQLLSTMRAKFDVKKAAKLVVTAVSADERFTFYLKEDYSLSKVVYERLTAPTSKQEVEYAQFKPVGQDFMLPHVVILTYDDRPKHRHIFEYSEIDISPPARAQVKEDLFKVPK